MLVLSAIGRWWAQGIHPDLRWAIGSDVIFYFPISYFEIEFLQTALCLATPTAVPQSTNPYISFTEGEDDASTCLDIFYRGCLRFIPRNLQILQKEQHTSGGRLHPETGRYYIVNTSVYLTLNS